MPAGVAISDAARGHWPHTARQDCAHFVQEAEAQPVTHGVRLLADLRTAFDQRDTDRLSTIDIPTDLTTLEEAPWGDINGKDSGQPSAPEYPAAWSNARSAAPPPRLIKLSGPTGPTGENDRGGRPQFTQRPPIERATAHWDRAVHTSRLQ
jgi:hypothetical protein